MNEESPIMTHLFEGRRPVVSLFLYDRRFWKEVAATSAELERKKRINLNTENSNDYIDKGAGI